MVSVICALTLAMSGIAGQADTIPNWTTSLAIGAKSNRLFMGCDDGSVRVIDLKTLTLQSVLQIPGTYRSLDDPQHTGSNSIGPLVLSDDEHLLAASRSKRDSGSCIELFDLQSNTNQLIPAEATMPDFASGSLYFEALPDGHIGWDIWERSSDGALRSLIKSNAHGQNLWFTDKGFVRMEDSKLTLYPSDGTPSKSLPMPAGAQGWIPAGRCVVFDHSGRHAMIDQRGNLFYAAGLNDEPKPLGKADPSPRLLQADGYYTARLQFVGSDELVTCGNIVHSNGKWNDSENGDCTNWDLKTGRKTFAFKLKADSSKLALAASNSLVAISYQASRQEPGRVDLFSRSDGKLIATLTSPYSVEPGRVQVFVKLP